MVDLDFFVEETELPPWSIRLTSRHPVTTWGVVHPHESLSLVLRQDLLE